MLDSTKSNERLNWKNTLSLNETLSKTIEWYKMYNEQNLNPKEFTISQIKKYVELAQQRDMIWTK